MKTNEFWILYFQISLSLCFRPEKAWFLGFEDPKNARIIKFFHPNYQILNRQLCMLVNEL